MGEKQCPPLLMANSWSPVTYEYVMLGGKGGSADVIKVKVLEMGRLS